jgi:hypothetical protein
MFATRALALSLTDVALFPLPPRPQRPGRRSVRGTGIAGNLVRMFRRELEIALRDPAAGTMPRLGARYPY